MENEIQSQPNPVPAKLPVSAHLMSGWPFVLVAFGGAIGGGLGGAAYAINLSIYKSQLPIPVKILLNIVTGIGAFVIWFGIAVAITIARQS